MTDQTPTQRIARVIGVNTSHVSAALPTRNYAEEDARMAHRAGG
ncbi:MAG: hypothetical protein ACLFVO_20735 [Chloroflexaceae bacterium]